MVEVNCFEDNIQVLLYTASENQQTTNISNVVRIGIIDMGDDENKDNNDVINDISSVSKGPIFRKIATVKEILILKITMTMTMR